MTDPLGEWFAFGAADLAVVAGTLLVAGLVRGFVGFGAALMIVAVLSTVFGPLFALPFAALVGLPATVQLLPAAVRDGEASFVLPIGITAFAVAPLGTFVLVTVDPGIMKIVISSMVLVMTAVIWRGRRVGGGGIPSLVCVGAACGLIQGSAGMGGPPVVAFALARAGSPERQRANVIGAVTALGLCSIPPMLHRDLFTGEVILLAVLSAPLYIGSTWVGIRMFAWGGGRHFRNAALAVLAGIGCVTLGLSVEGHLH